MKQKNTRSGGIARGAAVLTFSVVLLKVLGLLYKISLSHLLGDEGMGYFNAAYTVYTFFYLLCSTGVPKAVAVMVGAKNADGGEDAEAEKAKVFAVCTRMFFLAGALLTAAFFCLSGPIAYLIGNRSAFFSMLAIAPSVFFVALSGVLRGYLNGEERFGSIALSQTAEGVVRFLFGILFARIGASLALPPHLISALSVAGITLSSVIGYMILYIRYKIENSGYNIKQNKIEGQESSAIRKRFLSVAVPITLTSAVSGVSGLFDLALLIRRLESIGYSETAATAVYGNYTTLVLPMVNLVVSLLSPICVCALPVFAARSAANDGEGMRTSLSSFLRVTAAIAAPCAFGLMLFAPDVLRLFYEPASAALAAPVLAASAPAVLLSALLTMLNTALEATGHTGISFLSMSLSAAGKLILTWFLVGDPAVGIYGAPIGALCSYALGLLISYCYLRVRMKVRVSLLGISAAPCIAGALAVGYGRFLRGALSARLPETFVTLICILFCAVCYVLLAVFFGYFRQIYRFFCEKRTKIKV